MAGDASPKRFDRRSSHTSFGFLFVTWLPSTQITRPMFPPSGFSSPWQQ